MTLLKTKSVHFATDPVEKRPYFMTLIRRLKILKENHTLFSDTNPLGDLRVNYKTNPVSEVSRFLDESEKIDSSLNVAFRVAFYVPLLLTK